MTERVQVSALTVDPMIAGEVVEYDTGTEGASRVQRASSEVDA